MAREARKSSGTGIYHVIMRGINHQNIFEDPEDYYQFVATLYRVRTHYADDGRPCGINCVYYAYCLMSNHFHLLIREQDESVGDVMKRIAGSYVYYYNHKYQRDGHLFKERFKSEPVNDMEYFVTLLRYIHQNPVKAGIKQRVADYEYSSWSEYLGDVDSVFQICNTAAVLRRMTLDDLSALVNEPLSDDVSCLEVDEKMPRLRLSDDQVCVYIAERVGAANISEFQHLPRESQRELLRDLRRMGASVRQLERLTGISRGIIQSITF